MSDENTIVRRSLKDRRPGKTDWKAVDQLTDAEIKAQVAADPDAAPIADAAWFKNARVVIPEKEHVSIRLDANVLAYFRGLGPRYQTRINEVLKAYVDAATHGGQR